MRRLSTLCLLAVSCCGVEPRSSDVATTTTAVESPPAEASVPTVPSRDGTSIRDRNEEILQRLERESQEARARALLAGNPPITEIRLSQDGCFRSCPSYTVVLYADGRAFYLGDRYAERRGWHRASIDDATFSRLAEWFEEWGFFEPEDSDDVRPSGTSIEPGRVSTRTVSAVRGERRKSVTTAAGAGPKAVRILDDHIEQVWPRLDWTPCVLERDCSEHERVSP